jgi:Flp pilus assembly protein TadB
MSRGRLAAVVTNDRSRVDALPAGDSASDLVAPVCVGGLVGLVVGFAEGIVVGCAIGSATAFGLVRLIAVRRAAGGGRATRGGPATAGRFRRLPAESPARQIPAALDLLAACLSAGAAPAQALAAVGDAFEGEVGATLSAVARLTTLGAPIETAWSACLHDRRWAPIARAVIRAHYSGAALTDVLAHLALDRRRALRADAEAAAQRAGVRAVLPLGVCFLPAFILVGVVPVVAGFAHTLWS